MKIDPKKYGTVAVLLGGTSAEREISLKSGKAIYRALREAGLNVIKIGEEEDIISGIREREIDLVFIALHGRFGEDGQIQGLLERMNIPYTGSGVMASRRAMDKIASREIFREAGLLMPESRIYGSEDKPSRLPFSLPVVVKPAREGSSIGLSLVRKEDEFAPAISEALSHDERIIVEKYIRGRELTVGILDGKPLTVIEIVPENDFFDFEAKYVKGRSGFVVPAKLAPETNREAGRIGLEAHRALDCFAYSRADIILGDDGSLYLLEVNTIPGFTSTSLLPQAAAAAGITFPELCLKLLDLALEKDRN